MSDFGTHLDLYKKFKKDAENTELFEGTRVEAYFLSAFHLIEARAARERVHINKHQRIRAVIEENEFLFGNEGEIVWRSFQIIENKIRPKFAYSMSWTKSDLDRVIENYGAVEKICLKAIGNV